MTNFSNPSHCAPNVNPDDTEIADKHLIDRRVSGPRSDLKAGVAPTDQPGEKEMLPNDEKLGALALYQAVSFEVRA